MTTKIKQPDIKWLMAEMRRELFAWTKQWERECETGNYANAAITRQDIKRLQRIYADYKEHYGTNPS